MLSPAELADARRTCTASWRRRRRRGGVRRPWRCSAGSSTALGAAWFNPAAGVLAAAIVLTREPVLDFGARAYVDIPYLVLVLGALLVETRRPRAGAPVLGLLALAGLLRPEAWLLSAAYLAWLLVAASATWARVGRLAGLAAVGPLLWLPARPAGDRRPAALADRARATRPRCSAASPGSAHVPGYGAAPARRDPARAGAARGGGRRRPVAAVAAPAGGARGRDRRRRGGRPSACWRRPACRSSPATCCSRRASWRSSAGPGPSAGSSCARGRSAAGLVAGGGRGRRRRPARVRPVAGRADRDAAATRCAARRRSRPTSAG